MPAELHDQEFELSGPLIVSLSHLIPQHLTLTRARGYRQSYRERERERQSGRFCQQKRQWGELRSRDVTVERRETERGERVDEKKRDESWTEK